MKKIVVNILRHFMHDWRFVLCTLFLLTACTAREYEEPNENMDSLDPAFEEEGDWQVPGLVDRTGTPIEVPMPNPATGRTIDVTDFGADPLPNSQDDASAIRQALSTAEPGDQVVFPAGIYDLNSTDPEDKTANIVLRSGVDLIGAGRERTVLLTSFNGEEDSRVIRASGNHDCIIADFTITSRYEGPLGDDPDEEAAGGGPMYGIYIGPNRGVASSRVLVKNVSIRKFQRHGISVKASREIILSGNYISEATSIGPGGKGYGVAIEGVAKQLDPDADNDSRYNVVIGNIFDGRHLRHAILLQFPTHNNLIAENTIIGSHLDAIDLHGEGEYLNEIRNNTIIGGKRAAIALGNSGGTKHKHDASGAGNWIHSNLLVGNRQGIQIILGTPNTMIENNNIIADEDSKVGIEIRNAPGTELRDNYITGQTDGFWAIWLKDDRGADGRGKGIPFNIKIKDNTIRRAANGIRIDAGKNLHLSENVLNCIDGVAVKVAEGVEVDGTAQRFPHEIVGCEKKSSGLKKERY